MKTVVLFFTKGAPTRRIWYYQLKPGRSLGKTNPLNDDDLKDFVEQQRGSAESAQSWTVDVAEVDTNTWDLSVKDPHGGEAVEHRSPLEILDEIARLDRESAELLQGIRWLL